MNLFKWTKNLKPKFPNIIENFFGKKINENTDPSIAVASIPSVNIKEKKKTYEISLALPGLEKEDINIEITNDRITISSQKQYEKEESDEYWMRREFGYAAFQRIFELPKDCDTDKVNASMNNGILKVVIGKKKEEEITKRKINLK